MIRDTATRMSCAAILTFAALAAPVSQATHEVSSHATRAVEHHIERRLRSVAVFEHH